MKLLDLFAGIGGFSLAAHWLGWETAAFVERDQFCQQVLRKNFGDVPIYNDITTFDGRPFRGTVDVISGGFPCQPFSNAGLQRGKDDERYLFPEMLRVISEVRPRWIVAENVRNILTIGNGEVFEEICSHLEGENYEVQTYLIPVCAVDAPHRRERIWIIAHSKDGVFGGDAADLSRSHEPANRPERSKKRISAPRIADRAFAGDVADIDRRNKRAGLRKDGSIEHGIEFADRYSNEHWLIAATRLCRVDDGISDRLDGVRNLSAKPANKKAAGRDHRQRGLGNAIFPGIAYELFRAIEAAD